MTKQDMTKDVLLKLGGTIMSLALAVTSWFLNQAWSRISKLEDDMKRVEISIASTSSNRFSTADWVSANALLDSELVSIDKRVAVMEATLPVIKDSLLEIKRSVEKINEKN